MYHGRVITVCPSCGPPARWIDLNGWIELTTDGEQIWVEAERKL
jgi:hypothetical protein